MTPVLPDPARLIILTVKYVHVARYQAISVWCLLLLLPFMMTDPVWGIGNRDPETGRIKVLYVGEPTGASPYPMLEADPLIIPYPVKASACVFSFGIARRSMRQYMPRTYEDLSSYQVFILSDANSGVFTSSQLRWFHDSVNEGGSGLTMIGGNEAFGGRAGYASWGPTPVADVLPVNCLDSQWFDPGEVRILEFDHPLTDSLPLRPGLVWMRSYDGNRVEMRGGAQELARVFPRTGQPAPFWATWEYGEGRTFAMAGDWTPGGGVVFMTWEYYGDFAINLMLYLSYNELPEDLETMHEARRKFLEYRSSKAYLFNIMEFGEKFGANMNPLSEIIEEADVKHEEAREAYLDLVPAQSAELLDTSLEILDRGVDRAMELKDQAMLWIFIVEWTSVTATFFAGGFAVWTLMIRRRLYREAGTTRFRGRL